jgi:AAA+ superfamily predicted ATPase
MGLFDPAPERARHDAPTLPAWARAFQQRLRQRGHCMYILSGPGVRDLHPLGPRRFGPLPEFLADGIFGSRAAIITYDRGAGIRFGDTQTETSFHTALKNLDRLRGTTFAQSWPRDPDRALQLIESWVRNQLAEQRQFSCAVILDYAETIAPIGEPGQLSVEDRGSIVTLRRWASDPVFLRRDCSFCLITESTASLNQALVADPRTVELQVPVPDEEERYRYLTGRGATPDTFSRIDPRSAAVLTAGLTRVHLESLLAEADARGGPLDPDALNREKRRLIEESSGGLLSFVTASHGLDAVAGHEGAKALLRETAHALRAGRLDVVPMGFLICGPVGTGKSFLVRCFASEIGVPVVELRNFRSMWQGQTEANLERILAILDAMGPVAVMVDEADAALGNREQAGHDSGVSERVFASLAAFMGDTRRRGRTLWFLMTSRPDLVPVDLKRQGRAEEHIALFPPASPEERATVFEAIRARLTVPVASGLDPAPIFAAVHHPMSAADIEAVLVRASRRLATSGQKAVTAELLRELIGDFQPPAYPLEIEYQRLIAAFECTSKALLPPDLALMPAQEIAQRLAQLRAALGR